jgi:hypothetical protein
VKWSQLPVYVAAELLAGVCAALLYGLISRTRADSAAISEPVVVGETPVPVSPEGGPVREPATTTRLAHVAADAQAPTADRPRSYR